MNINLNKIFFCVGVGFCFSLLFLVPLTSDAQTITEENILEAINLQRQEKELKLLTIDQTLSHVADLRAQDMLLNNYFSHQSLEGLMPWDLAKMENYNYRILGENLAMDYYDTGQVLNDWLNSIEHRNNILNPQYSETGISIMDNNKNLLIVQIFAQPANENQTASISYNSINDQSVVSIIPNNANTENLNILGAYEVKIPVNSQNYRINMYNLWIFLLTLAFFPISLYFLLMPDKITTNQ